MAVLVEEIDGLLRGPVLVFGSIPPDARDLDLLVPDDRVSEVRSSLVSAGYTRSGDAYVRFHNCSADEVDVVPVGDWDLPPEVVTDLFQRARDLDALEWLKRPATHHALLILARRHLFGMDVDEGKRARIGKLLDESPGAWDEAAEAASHWGLVAPLEGLRRTYETGSLSPVRPPGPGVRGAVISISGVDGCGKSTQAEHLRSTLERLGIEAVVEWSKLARDASLDVVSRPVKKVIGLLPRRHDEEPDEDRDPEAHLRRHPDGPKAPPDAGTLLRRRSRSISYVWTFLVATANGSTHRRVVRDHVRAGRVVICDRYVLDSSTHLRWRYGKTRQFTLQKRLLRLLSPRELRSYWLDVSPETARARKAEQFTTRDLTGLRKIYEEESRRLGTVRIDGEASLDQVCASIARDVWTALDRRPRGGRLRAALDRRGLRRASV